LAIEYGFKDIDEKAPRAAHAGRRLTASMKKYTPAMTFEIARTMGLTLAEVEA
jgi:hypothetical protein